MPDGFGVIGQPHVGQAGGASAGPGMQLMCKRRDAMVGSRRQSRLRREEPCAVVPPAEAVRPVTGSFGFWFGM